ncbi:hypothetical protein LPY66_16140 [Dehalobacter sp. DCM]|uniref:hypothetical protein n=1 Tax=Dehalobacter sp. DCM TaxID=2907827 RepID=UPI0030817B50|nr:hypothetical protein LPY66_16140 [Dehalobacter sp. DCM]
MAYEGVISMTLEATERTDTDRMRNAINRVYDRDPVDDTGYDGYDSECLACDKRGNCFHSECWS